MRTNRLLPTALRHVDDVARRGSIQRTARELNLAASAINRQLLALEAELGVALFERLPRGMRPTPAGDAVVAMARQWRADLRRLFASLDALRGTDQAHIRIGAMDSHANGLLPPLLARVATEFPSVSVSVSLASTDDAAAALLGEEVDLVIAHNLHPSREMRAVATEALPLGCVVAPSHALAAHGRVTLQQVARYPLALQDRSLVIRRHLDANHGWLLAGRPPPIETNSLQLLKALARSGRYAAFTSELDAWAELQDGTLRFVRVGDTEAAAQSVCVAVGARHTSRTVQRMAEMAADAVRVCLRR